MQSLGYGAISVGSWVAGLWAAVLFQSMWLNLVNIKYLQRHGLHLHAIEANTEASLARFIYAKNRLEGTIQQTGWCWSVGLFGAPLSLFFNFCSTWITIRTAHSKGAGWVDAITAVENWRLIFVMWFLSLNAAQLYPLGYLTSRYQNLHRFATRKIVPPQLPTPKFREFVNSLYLLKDEGVIIQPGVVITVAFSLKFFAACKGTSHQDDIRPHFVF